MQQTAKSHFGWSSQQVRGPLLFALYQRPTEWNILYSVVDPAWGIWGTNLKFVEELYIF